MENYRQKEQIAISALQSVLEDKDTNISLVPKKTTHILRERKKNSRLNLRAFNQVLKVDPEKLELEVEGCTSFKDIVQETLKYGLIPKIVPEFSGITIGGTVSGIGLESSSFKYGFVQETLKEITLLTGEAKVLTCSRENNSDLFNALPNSFGSLGYVLRCKAELIKAKKYVEIKIFKHTNLDKYFEQMKKLAAKDENDFLDGAIYGPGEAALVLGRMTDQLPAGIQLLNITKKAYYQEIRQAKNGSTFYLKMSDYLFRWDKDAFWGMESYPILKWFLSNGFFRSFLFRFALNTDKLLEIKKKRDKIVDFFNKMIRKNNRHEELIQDFGIDINKSAEFVDWYAKSIGLFPLWVCPLKKRANPKVYPLFDFKADMIIDLGFYGVKKLEKNLPEDHYLKLGEKKVLEMGGMKGLYSRNGYSEREFWDIYDKEGYFIAKNKYDPNKIFPDVYHKISKG